MQHYTGKWPKMLREVCIPLCTFPPKVHWQNRSSRGNRKSRLSTGRTHIGKDGLGRWGEAFLLQKDGLARGSWHLAIGIWNQMCIFCHVVIKSYVYNCELQIHHDELYQMDPICMHRQGRQVGQSGTAYAVLPHCFLFVLLGQKKWPKWHSSTVMVLIVWGDFWWVWAIW